VGGFYDRIEHPAYATAVGLVLAGARRDRQTRYGDTMLGVGEGLPGVGRAVRRVREWVGQLF
jgi:hypothetical protein